jgi:hypothetical protein
VSITLFESWDEIAALVGQFESGELPAARWTHREHLTVAFWYVSRLPQEAAMERMRQGIIHLNGFHGTPNTDTRGYHETITRFWMDRVGELFEAREDGQTLLEGVNQVIQRYGRRRSLWREYYSFDLMRSVSSRRGWIPPDLRPLRDSDLRSL